MVILNCSILKKELDECFRTVDETKFAFHKSEWDDPVHTSFEKFLKELALAKNELHTNYGKISTIKGELALVKDPTLYHLDLYELKLAIMAVIIP